jgi:hypothetical protein
LGYTAFTELLIDCEEDRTLRAVLVGLLGRLTDRDRAHREPAPHGESAFYRSVYTPDLPRAYMERWKRSRAR